MLTLAFLFRVQFVYIYEIWEMYIVHFSSLVTLILLFKVVCHATNVEGIHYPNYPLIIDFIEISNIKSTHIREINTVSRYTIFVRV